MTTTQALCLTVQFNTAINAGRLTEAARLHRLLTEAGR